MNGWREVTLDELGTVERGRSRHRPRNDPSLYGSEMPFFQTGDVKAAVLHLGHPQQWYSAAGVQQSRVWEPGITCITIAANIADTAVLGERGCFPDSVLGFTPKDHVDDAYFVKYLLDGHRETLGAAARGTTQDNLSLEKLLSFRFSVPPVSERVVIARTLCSIDDLIENNRRRIEVLEEMARAIYREWFVHFRYPGHETFPLVDSSLGPVPEGWTVHPFSEVADFVNGFAFKPSHWGNEGRPIVKIKELKHGVVADTPRCSPKVVDPKFWVERGDLLFSWSADLGVYLWRDEPGLLNQHLFTVRPKRPGLTLGFLLHALDESMPQFRSRAQGTTMRHIKRSALSEVEVLLPDDTLTGRFTRDIEPMHDEIARLGQESRSLETMRDLLLPRLVSGQIDLSTLDLTGLLEGAVA